ncbi:hypothetical protein [Parapedobacter koreensis]|uniref:Uncharacterized protein n=1 Tax=Parapedobacter koreensis TaxID=332977 RepID=A0A1H7Q9C8_9SPHI|nr:hypothetical protein [Parapedobacter koreensis]SEL44761.1 hypothetical protein SAMN05421740_105256 [Parapedobacter koreensis]
MKFFIILMFMLCSFAYTFSQDSLSLSQQHEFLTNENIVLKPSQIIANFRPTERHWLADRGDDWTQPKPKPFESAYHLNVFDFFKEAAIYDTNLKKEVFKETDEYKYLLDSLKGVKAEFLNSAFYAEEWNVGTFFYGLREDYDINKRGFFVQIGPVRPDYCKRSFLPKVIGDIEFKQLQIHKRYDNLFHGNKSYTQYIFIPMDATTALEVEDNRSDVGFLFVFDIKGVYTALFNDEDFSEHRRKSLINKEPCRIEVVRGNNLRLILYNKTSDKIYYDKIFRAI